MCAASEPETPATTPAATSTTSATSAAGARRPGRGARERILAAAATLFARQGINATGMEQLAEAAPVSKRTLYAHFPAKSDLVMAHLRELATSGHTLESVLTCEDLDPRTRILRMFDPPAPAPAPVPATANATETETVKPTETAKPAEGATMADASKTAEAAAAKRAAPSSDGTPAPERTPAPVRGCPFIDAAVEFPDPDSEVHGYARERKLQMARLVTELATELGAVDPAPLAEQLVTLADGAASRAMVLDAPDYGRHARAAAETLLDLALTRKE